MEFERGLHGIGVFTVHRKMSNYATDGDFFLLHLFLGSPIFFAVITHTHTHTHT